MTDIDTTTTTFTAEEARILTDGIKSALVATWNLREQAYRGRVWIALGYSSWETYCEAEFSTVAIPRAERGAVVAAMRSAGMSTRAIAAATGLGVGTVHRELSGVPDGTPEVITGADGKIYSASRPQSATPNTDELIKMIKPPIPMAGLPDAFKDLNESLMARFDVSPEALAPLVEEQRAKPLDVDRCKTLAGMSEVDFEDLISEFTNPPSDYSDDEVIMCHLHGLRVRMERRIGELLLQDEEGGR